MEIRNIMATILNAIEGMKDNKYQENLIEHQGLRNRTRERRDMRLLPSRNTKTVIR